MNYAPYRSSFLINKDSFIFQMSEMQRIKENILKRMRSKNAIL